MSYRILILTTCIVAVVTTTAHTAHPEIPGSPQKTPIAIVGATIHTAAGDAIENGTIVFDKGRIVSVGKSVKLPPNTERIDGIGKHVYPGLFDAMTNMGLVEINSIRATVDDSETGELNPNVRSQVAVNPDSAIIPTTRSNGVLLTLTAPTGGLISGRSSVLQLDGWTWEDMTLKSDIGMHIRWPRMDPVSDWWVEKTGKQQITDRDAALKKLEEAFVAVRAYRKARAAAPAEHPVDLRWEAMLPVLDGKLPLIAAADDVQQIQAAVAFSVRHKVRLIVTGGYDALRCSALLKKHKIPVVVAGTYRLPVRRDDDYDAAYTLPARLQKAGIKYCISSGGRFGASNVRNLPYHAATAVAYGLKEAEAIRAITLYPAQILGVDARVGSLEVGKDATIFLTDGNPLVIETQVRMAFVQGRRVDLNDRHKRLYRKYQQKYSPRPR